MRVFAPRGPPAVRREVVSAPPCTLLAALGLVASPAPLRTQQQSSTLLGHVIDRQSGSAIVGATVIILGWSLEAGTDSTGCFRYTGLRPGSYMLQGRAVGYTVTNWVVRMGDAEEQH